MKVVFITGGSSRIGRAVAEELVSDHRLVFLRNRRPVPAASANCEVLDGGLAAVSRHEQQIRAADVVLHMAAVTHERSEAEYLEVNVKGTRRLLAACRDDQPVVYLSTRCVGEEGGAYGRSKWLAEQIIRAKGLPHAIVRPSEIYGSGSGEGIDSLLEIARRTRLLADFQWPGGISYSPISVNELVEFLVGLVRSGRVEDQTYTLANERDYSAREIQRSLERSLGKWILRVPIPVRVLLVARALHLPLPFSPDQIDRLIMRKSAGDGLARKDFGFDPRCFLDWIESDWARPRSADARGG